MAIDNKQNATALANAVALWYKKLFSMSKEEKLAAIDEYLMNSKIGATDEEASLLKKYMTQSDDETMKSIDSLSQAMQLKLANLSLGLAAFVNGRPESGLQWTTSNGK